VAAATPVVACAQCGTALAADAKFCAVCGKTVTAEQQSEAAAVEPHPELLEALPAPSQDRWES
jgi:predicted amidophosphoribosyltransferase